MMTPSYAIFDLDGTLVDSAVICTDILNEMLHERGSGRVISVEEAKPHLSRGGLHMIVSLLGAECFEPEAELVEFRRRYAEWPTPANSMFDGVHEGLHELAEAGMQLAVCSNKPQHLCEKVISDLGLGPIFSTIVGSSPDRRPKPDPHLMQITLEKLGAAPTDCIFVGDSGLDQALAEATGVPFMFVSYGYADEGWDPSGVPAFSRFHDVVEAIRLLRARPAPLRRVA